MYTVLHKKIWKYEQQTVENVLLYDCPSNVFVDFLKISMKLFIIKKEYFPPSKLGEFILQTEIKFRSIAVAVPQEIWAFSTVNEYTECSILK